MYHPRWSTRYPHASITSWHSECCWLFLIAMMKTVTMHLCRLWLLLLVLMVTLAIWAIDFGYCGY